MTSSAAWHGLCDVHEPGQSDPIARTARLESRRCLMLRRTLSLVALSLIAASCAPEMMGTNTYLGFRLDITSAPPPPRVRFYDEGPRLVVIPDTRVYYVDN